MSAGAMDDNDVPDQVDLLRLVWDPDDIVEGELQPSAFPSADLVGHPQRFLSVDRADELVPEAVRYVAAAQKERARHLRELQRDREENALQRDMPFGALLLTRAAREIEVPIDLGQKSAVSVVVRPLAVSPNKIPVGHEACPMGNAAHCAMANVSGKRSRGFINALRAKLIAAAHTLLPLEEILGESGERDG